MKYKYIICASNIKAENSVHARLKIEKKKGMLFYTKIKNIFLISSNIGFTKKVSDFIEKYKIKKVR